MQTSKQEMLEQSAPPVQAIPLLDLKAQYAPLREEIRAAVDRVMDSQVFIMGPEVQALEQEVAAYSQCRYGIGMSSGTDALLAALMAVDIGPGHEVITTPYTFFATAGCIARLGARPVFVDIDPRTYNIDTQQLADKITRATRAIIPVHLFGQMADMTPILALAERHGLCVIEDAAQAIGAELDGRRAGSLGQMGCFSFFPSKNLGGFGDGGMVVTNDPSLAAKLDILRKHGSQPKYYHQMIGGNFRLDALQAVVLRIKLQHLDAWTAARQRNADRYQALFAAAGITEAAGLQLPYTAPARRHIYNQYVVRVPRRDQMLEHLKQARIGTEVYYPVPLHLQECFRGLGYGVGDFPASEAAAQSTLALPIYPELSATMQARIVETIAANMKPL
jgi:dTDP-4-amino-4,6-dideoxygalactose transaminase